MKSRQKVVAMQTVKYILHMFLLIGSLAFLNVSRAFASTGDEGSIAISQWSVDRLGQPGYVGVYFLFVLVLALIALVWVSNASTTGIPFNRDSGASNLFLGVKFEKLSGSPDDGLNRSISQSIEVSSTRATESEKNSGGLGYLRELGLKEALLVSPSHLYKNDQVLLHLDSLPNYPKKLSEIRGIVKTSKSLGGEPENFLVRVEFENASSAVKYDLPHYLEHLSSKGGGAPLSLSPSR